MSATPKNSIQGKAVPKSGDEDRRAKELEGIQKNLAKRSFNIKFDLENTGYKPIEKIGIGAYGVVCSAIHASTNEKVAVKKIPYVFEALAIAKRTYREIKILKHFKHDNIISIREILKPKEGYHEFKDIYVVFDLMESDLHRIIYSEQALTEEHIRYFLYQILRGLKYIHSASVVHRDLKPSNLLVNEDCHVRIGDFGMARAVNCQPEEPSHYMTQYVATRWYRAPEILLSLLEYGTAVDMWSVGCIFAEMLGRKHLFPGKDYLHQVKLVLGILGTPSQAVLKNCQNDVLSRILKGLGPRQPLPWTTLFPKATKKALDLLGKMLVINPAERVSVDRALQHPFLSKYHDPDDEPICVPTFEFDFEKELLHMDQNQLREVIYKEIMEFHQPRTPTLSFSACLRPAPKAEDSPDMPSVPLSSSLSSPFGDLQSFMSVLTNNQDKQIDQILEENKSTSPTEESANSQTSSGNAASTLQQHQLQRAEVFKKPGDKPATKKSPVSVDTSSLQLPSLSDVEMLSAQSTDGSKPVDMQTPRITLAEKQTDLEKDNRHGDKKENKTISEDTKALVKQALLSHRQRTESIGEEDKPRPVTAAQRQREREEKRKKKKDREKMKKIRDKKTATQMVQLTDADKELLARWASMQKIQPKESAAQQHQQPQQASSATLVYIQPANSSSGSQPQPTTSFSPSHPASSSTVPTDGSACHVAQIALVARTVPMPQGSSSVTQITGPENSSLVVSLPGNLLQGQTTAITRVSTPEQQQQTSRSSFHEGDMIPILALPSQSGSGIHITDEQAEALKEVLKMTPSSVSGGRHAEGFDSRHSLTPPLQSLSASCDSTVQVGVTTTAAVFLPSSITSSASPFNHQSDSAVPSPPVAPNRQTSSPGFAHSPVRVSVPEESNDTYTNSNSLSIQGHHFETPQQDYVQTGQTQLDSNFSNHASLPDSFSRVNVTATRSTAVPVADRLHNPQDLSEFLDRHCTESRVNVSAGLFHGEHSPVFISGMKESKSPQSQGTNSPDCMSKQKVYNFSPCGQFSQQMERTSSSLPHSQDSSFFGQQTGIQPSYNNTVATQSLSSNDCFSGSVFTGANSVNSMSGVHLSPQLVRDGVCVHGQPLYMMPTEEAQYSHCERLQKNQNAKSLSFRHLVAGSSTEVDQFSGFVQAAANFQAMKVPITQSDYVISASSCFGSHPNLVHAQIIEGHAAQAPPEHSFGVDHILQNQTVKCCMTQGVAAHHHQSQQQHPHQQEMLSNILQQQQQQHVHLQETSQQHHHRPLEDSYHHHHHHPQLLPEALQQNPQLPQPPQQPSSTNRDPGLRVSAPKHDASADLIAMLSKQLSRSQLDSIFPPALSLTPRGTGAGYGVGMDLDQLMADTLDTSNSMRAELSPLSSSLLADWLEVTGNISQADLDALEQDFSMQSPVFEPDFHSHSTSSDRHWDSSIL